MPSLIIYTFCFGYFDAVGGQGLAVRGHGVHESAFGVVGPMGLVGGEIGHRSVGVGGEIPAADAVHGYLCRCVDACADRSCNRAALNGFG